MDSSAADPWIFIHGTNIVDRGLKALFFGVFLLLFGLFFRCPPPPWKGLNSAIFGLFLLFFGLFLLPSPLEIFLPTPLYVPVFKNCLVLVFIFVLRKNK